MSRGFSCPNCEEKYKIKLALVNGKRSGKFNSNLKEKIVMK